MEHLNERHGPALAQRALHHLELRLRGVPTLSHLAPEIRALRIDLKAKHEAWLEAQDTRMVATSAVRYADDEQDRAVTRLSQGLLLVLDGDRGAARYRRVFPLTPTEVNAGVGSVAQQEAVAQILEAAKGEAGVDPLRLSLAAAFGALNAALADRVAAARAESSARMDLVLGLEDVAAAYRRFGARLISDGVEARLVESCFMSLRRAPSDRLDAAGDEGGVEAR
ncbi:MAG: hypothetical protein JNM72_04125 [Deltaproteobacteria bacterium]|nr:hypothetical protein [Deltaproteobacteria bacterium]